MSIESALSAFPLERVIQVQVCLSIESALSAFDLEGGGHGSGSETEEKTVGSALSAVQF